MKPFVMDRGYGIRSGLSSEGNSTNLMIKRRSSHSPMAAEKFRHLIESFEETDVINARGRATYLDEHLDQFNRNFEAMPLQKQHSLENQIFQRPLDLGDHKVEDCPKNVFLNRRRRHTSVAETQDGYTHEVSMFDAPSGKRFKIDQSKTESKDITNQVELVDQGSYVRKVKTLGQRLAAALIKLYDIEDYAVNDADMNSLNYAPHLLVNGDYTANENDLVHEPLHTRSITSSNEATLRREDERLNSEVQAMVELSVEGQYRQINSIDGPYDQLPIETKLLLELQSIGLYPKTTSDLVYEENDLNKEIIRLKNQQHQQVNKKEEQLDKLHDANQKEKNVEEQNIGHVAMDNPEEITNKKLSSTQNLVIINVPPLCVDEADPLIGSTWPGIFIDSSAPTNNAVAEIDASEMPCRQSDQVVAKSGPILNIRNNGGVSNTILLLLDSGMKKGKRSKRGHGNRKTSSHGFSPLCIPKSKPKPKAIDNVKFSSGGGGGGSSEGGGGRKKKGIGEGEDLSSFLKIVDDLEDEDDEPIDGLAVPMVTMDEISRFINDLYP